MDWIVSNSETNYILATFANFNEAKKYRDDLNWTHNTNRYVLNSFEHFYKGLS